MVLSKIRVLVKPDTSEPIAAQNGFHRALRGVPIPKCAHSNLSILLPLLKDHFDFHVHSLVNRRLHFHFLAYHQLDSL